MDGSLRNAVTNATRQVLAIIDIDCAVENGFDEEDRLKLEELASVLAETCDW